MGANPLAVALAAFGEGQRKGRDRRRAEERQDRLDRQAAEQIALQNARQSALDRANQEFRQWQMQEPTRQAAVRDEARNFAAQERERMGGVLARAREAFNAGRYSDPAIGAAMAERPDLSDEFRVPKLDAITAYQQAQLDMGARRDEEIARHNRAMEGQSAQRITQAGNKQTKLPGLAIEKMIDLDATMELATQAQRDLAAAVQAKQNATSSVGKFIPASGWVMNAVGMGGEKGQTARSAITNLLSTVGKMRSGGAITPQEFSRLEGFLPTVNEREEVVALKLRDFLRTLADIKRLRIANYQKYGGQPGGDEEPRDIMPYGGVRLIPPPEE